MSPMVEALRRSGAPIVALDATREPEACAAFGVMATPTTLIIRDGVVADVMLGVVRKDQLEAALR
jgi:thioredoxin 1